MVWQKGLLDFGMFFNLFVPSLVTYLVPAVALSLTLPSARPDTNQDATPMKRGAKPIMALFICTIITAVSFHNFLHLPPFLGMMTGLAYLQIYGYYLKKTHVKTLADRPNYPSVGEVTPFDSFEHVARAEWDTLLFFFGIIMSVGGLGFLGYLANLSELLYTDLGPTIANTLIGMLSSIVDNIPVMVAVLEMKPDMNTNQWLLVTLTTGVGGSMLSVGSAAGVALMGQARGVYTFFGHLKWTPIIAVGYFAAIGTHLLINGG
jgi:Na+/H+ antiporter NhaD/arsenite permease-like protein